MGPSVSFKRFLEEVISREGQEVDDEVNDDDNEAENEAPNDLTTGTLDEVTDELREKFNEQSIDRTVADTKSQEDLTNSLKSLNDHTPKQGLFKNMNLLYINVDDNLELAVNENVFALPLVKFYENGRLLSMVEGDEREEFMRVVRECGYV